MYTFLLFRRAPATHSVHPKVVNLSRLCVHFFCVRFNYLVHHVNKQSISYSDVPAFSDIRHRHVIESFFFFVFSLLILLHNSHDHWKWPFEWMVEQMIHWYGFEQSMVVIDFGCQLILLLLLFWINPCLFSVSFGFRWKSFFFLSVDDFLVFSHCPCDNKMCNDIRCFKTKNEWN